MTTLIAPGKSEAELREAIDARRAARWYCLEPWTCRRCGAVFRVGPSDFRETTNGIPKALECLHDIFGDPKFVLALCPACGKQNERPAPSVDPVPDVRREVLTWRQVALLSAVVVVVWLVIMGRIVGWW